MKQLSRQVKLTIGAIIFVTLLITGALLLVSPQVSEKLLNSIPFIFGVVLLMVAILFKPLRKTIGLLLVVLGAIACASIFGLVIGVPLILVGGLLLFSK